MKISKELKMYGELVNFVYNQLGSAKMSDSPKSVEAYYLITKLKINCFETYILSTKKNHYFSLIESIKSIIDREFEEILDKFKVQSLGAILK